MTHQGMGQCGRTGQCRFMEGDVLSELQVMTGPDPPVCGTDGYLDNRKGSVSSTSVQNTRSMDMKRVSIEVRVGFELKGMGYLQLASLLLDACSLVDQGLAGLKTAWKAWVSE